MGYFDDFANLHRLASENLLAAVRFGSASALKEACAWAQRAQEAARTDGERVLSIGIIRTIDDMTKVLDS